MGSKSLSQAKSDIESCLFEIVDPSPSDDEKDGLWRYFGSRCAYCGKKIGRKSRTGHIDHLKAKGAGFNHVSNRVLACQSCNGNEKREAYWRTFIKTKGSKREVQKRIAAIEKWTTMHRPPRREGKAIQELRVVAGAISRRICRQLEGEVVKLRNTRDRKKAK